MRRLEELKKHIVERYVLPSRLTYYTSVSMDAEGKRQGIFIYVRDAPPKQVTIFIHLELGHEDENY